MISNDNNPPSADPDSYQNFVAFNMEDINVIGKKDVGYCDPTCDYAYFKSMTVSYMNTYWSDVKFWYFVGDNYPGLFAISDSSKKKYQFMLNNIEFRIIEGYSKNIAPNQNFKDPINVEVKIENMERIKK